MPAGLDGHHRWIHRSDSKRSGHAGHYGVGRDVGVMALALHAQREAASSRQRPGLRDAPPDEGRHLHVLGREDDAHGAERADPHREKQAEKEEAILQQEGGESLEAQGRFARIP